MKHEINYKVLTSVSEIEETLTMQKKIWGDSVAASRPEMMATSHNGGVVIGAFMDKNMIGFCYGFPGYKGTEAYLCSHMLAVDPNYRNLGLGRELKLKQRDWAINYGYQKMVWTFDPLEARNAYLNLCKLGAYTKTYLPSYYGEMEDQLNQGLPSDRFLVEWELLSEGVKKALAGSSLGSTQWQSYPLLSEWSLQGEYPRPEALNEIQAASGFLVPVPGSIQEIKAKNPDLAREWRLAVRSQMILMFARGYSVVGLLRHDASICYYVLEKN